jgi:hypothetical protein
MRRVPVPRYENTDHHLADSYREELTEARALRKTLFEAQGLILALNRDNAELRAEVERLRAELLATQKGEG